MNSLTKKIFVLLAITFASIVNADENQSKSLSLSSLDDYLSYAALHSPALEGRFLGWKAALEQVPQSQALSDPQFTFGYFIQEVETKVGPQRSKLGIMQAFPWFGKLDAKSDIAMAKAEMSRQDYESEKLKLYNKVKSSWYEFAYLGQALKLARDNMELMKYYEQVARSKYQGSLAGHPDIIRAQIELAVLEDIVASLEKLKEPQSAKLCAIVNLPEGTVLNWPAMEEAEFVELDKGSIYDAILSANPELKGMDSAIAAGRGMVDLSNRQSYPDFAIGVDWIQTDRAEMAVNDSGKDPVVLMFSMNIPIWQQKNNAARRQAAATLRASELNKEQMQNDKLALAAELMYKIEDARRKMELNKNTLGEKAAELVKVSETAYRNGTLDFLSLVDAQRRQLKYMLDYYRAQTDYIQRISELEMLIGGEL